MGSVEIDVVNKNLFPSFKSKSVENNGIMFSYNADTQEFHAEGTTTSTNFYCNVECVEMNFLKANKNYIFSVNNSILEKCLFQITRANVGNNGDIQAGEKSATIVNLDKYIPNSVMLYSNNIEIGTKIDYTFKVQIEEGTTATNIVEHQSQTVIMPIQQEMLEGDYVADVEHHEWGKLESYNGETITTDYISTTGELTTGATVYYKLATPVNLELTSEQKAVRNQKLYTYKNITNIAVSDELASVDVTYKKDLETMFNNIIKQIPSSTSDTDET